MTGKSDQWLQLPEIAKMFGLSEESIKRLAKTQGFPLRRLTPYATPGVLESALQFAQNALSDRNTRSGSDSLNKTNASALPMSNGQLGCARCLRLVFRG